MRITCTATKRGTVFRFYKNDENFLDDLKPLVPLLLASNGEVIMGEDDVVDNTDGMLLLTAGPLTSDAEAELLRRGARYFAPDCPATSSH